ncbi:MAG: HEAT repeat protein [Planctomycetota bacterium]|jgi:HEAT repeat protein
MLQSRFTCAHWLSLSLVMLSACASSASDRKSLTDGTPYDARANARAAEPIGVTLSQINIAIEEWNGVILGARTPEEQRKASLLEQTIRRDVRERFEDILDQLNTGPLVNRGIAGAALGFSGEDRALPSLLAALEDPSHAVQRNALLGIGQLARPDTPLGGILAHMRDSIDIRIRINAIRALRLVLEAGAPRDEFRETVIADVRRALTDPIPEVRMYSVLILARLADVESIESLKILVYDEEMIVASAAGRALAFLGDKDPHQKGSCARALAGALDKVDDNVRSRLIVYLQQLSRQNWGRESEPWIEWAARLP